MDFRSAAKESGKSWRETLLESARTVSEEIISVYVSSKTCRVLTSKWLKDQHWTSFLFNGPVFHRTGQRGCMPMQNR